MSKTKSSPDVLLIQTNITLKQPIIDAIPKLKPTEREMLFADIQLELLRQGFEFVIAPLPNYPIWLQKQVTADKSLSRHEFNQTVMSFKIAKSIIDVIFEKRLPAAFQQAVKS